MSRLSLALALFLAACGDEGTNPRQEFESDVDACRANLTDIYNGLRTMKTEQGIEPKGSGVRFFAEVIASGTWEDTEDTRRVLTCPGKNVTPVTSMPSFADLAAVTGDHSRYAGRDNVNHPLERFPMRGTEPLIACDNEQGMNHDGVMNVLYADGSIKTFQVEMLRERKKLGPEEEVIYVGANSQVDDLRKLTLD